MKVIGLVGGMSWESSAEYYRLINRGIRERLGGMNSAKVLMYSVNHHEISELESKGQWAELLEILADSAMRVERAGADFLLICCNLMHKLADKIQQKLSIPLIHIADSTADAVKAAGVSTVGLLGARAVMDEDFFASRIADAGLKVLTPSEDEKDIIDDIIMNELAVGKVTKESTRRGLEIISALREKGAEGAILACTELPMLITEQDSKLPLFDTLKLHAAKAVELALQD